MNHTVCPECREAIKREKAAYNRARRKNPGVRERELARERARYHDMKENRPEEFYQMRARRAELKAAQKAGL
ncbi:MAG: hypothetical protein OSB57_01895 [Planctomycetota bacterium]|nr:hypothetical protein [Planctomycetota bacterium]